MCILTTFRWFDVFCHGVSFPQGCLAPVKVLIPPGSILDPTETAAVVGGNVLTSQRVVDVVLKAFEVCAASQVNHIIFDVAQVRNEPYRENFKVN